MPHFSFTPTMIAFYLFWVVLFFLLFRISITSNYSKKLWLYAKRVADDPTEKQVRILNEHLEARTQSYKNEKSNIINNACKSAFESQKVSPERKTRMLELLKEKGFVLEEIVIPTMETVVEAEPVVEVVEKESTEV